MNAAQKHLVTLLAAGAVAGGLGWYAWYGVKAPAEEAAARKASDERLFPVRAPGERAENEGALVFTQLTVRAKGGTTTLERGDAGWRITAPVSAPADAYAVKALLTQLQSAKFRATVEESPTDADLERYGLKTPTFSVTAKAYVPDAQGGGQDDASRQRTVTLHGGIENTFDGSVYVRREGDPRVYAADGAVRFALDKGPFELREKEFLGVDEATLTAIDVKARAHAWTLERGEDKAWRLVKPSALRADGAKVKSLLDELKGQRALAFPEDSAELRETLGFEQPVVDARLTPAKGEPVRVRLVGVKQDGTSRVYAVREQGSEATLAEVPAGALTVLDRAPRELRDKAVLGFKREDVQRVVIHPGRGAAPLSVSRVKGTSPVDDWELETPTRGKAQKWKLVSLLGALHALKASDFGEANPRQWEKYGITDASPGVTLLGADGRELARLWLGHEVPDAPERVYARGSGGEVLQVESSRLSELPTQASDVLEPTPSPDAGTAAAQP